MVATPNKERAAARMPMGHAAHHGPSREPVPKRCAVVGASVRAFVESAARAGWAAHAADLFADSDLIAIATDVVRLGSAGGPAYPHGIPGVVGSFPEAVCVYTGALENHPDVIEALARTRPLAGCSAASLHRVRDLLEVADVVRAAGLRFPETHATPDGLPADGSYLVKPRRSAGGRGVRLWHGGVRDSAAGDLLWQRFVRGVSRSASYVARAGTARLVGSSLALPSADWCGGRTFAYRGSIDVPLERLPDDLRRSFERLGAALAAAFDLTGLFGIDVIEDAAGDVHVLEVNPRPTASLELVERATGWSVAAAHLAACGWGDEPAGGAAADGVWAKAIAYAPPNATAARVTDTLARLAERWMAADGLPAVADVPQPDEPPVPGAPLVTVFARGNTTARALATLRGRVLDLHGSIAARSGSPIA
jgi:uncharacterized protein